MAETSEEVAAAVEKACEQTMKWPFKLLGVVILAGIFSPLASVGFEKQRTPAESTLRAAPQLFHDHPEHLWNRLHRHFTVRRTASGEEYGFDALDPLLWYETEYLLRGQSHQKALRLLGEFLQIRGEQLISDPLKGALLQRDLWAVFDWSAGRRDNYSAERAALRAKLGPVLWRLALPGDHVRALPDVYRQAIASGRYATEYDSSHRERAFLPPDLFEPRAPWVRLTARGPTAPSHVSTFSGRSVFYVFLRLPGGRKATLDYLAKLWHFPRPWRTETPRFGRRFPLALNPDLPQFPPGTQVALARRLVLFDTEGKLMVTPVTENVQIRVYREIPANVSSGFRAQDFFEFRMSRALLLAGEAGGLRPVAPDENIFRIFGGHDRDVFERNVENRPLKCVNCHAGLGIHSLRSVEALFPPRPLVRDSVEGEPGSGVPDLGALVSLRWKENRYDWGLLNALRPQPTTRPAESDGH